MVGCLIDRAVIRRVGNDVVIRVAVADTGMGLAPNQHSEIFEPYQRVDAAVASERPGSGMGLAISKRLVDLMGGSMKFQSQLGAGSRLEFTARFEKQNESTANAKEPAEPNDANILNEVANDTLNHESNEIWNKIAHLEEREPAVRFLEDPGEERFALAVADRDPFERARKVLHRSHFDVRVIHNNGDPSDSDLI